MGRKRGMPQLTFPDPFCPPLMCAQAPVAAIGMWCVPSALRPLGVALMTICIHLFGDVPSPPLLGLLQTSLSKVGVLSTVLLYLRLLSSGLPSSLPSFTHVSTTHRLCDIERSLSHTSGGHFFLTHFFLVVLPCI